MVWYVVFVQLGLEGSIGHFNGPGMVARAIHYVQNAHFVLVLIFSAMRGGLHTSIEFVLCLWWIGVFVAYTFGNGGLNNDTSVYTGKNDTEYAAMQIGAKVGSMNKMTG